MVSPTPVVGRKSTEEASSGPFVSSEFIQKICKGEDFSYNNDTFCTSCSLYVVCDGHQGPDAAEFVRDKVVKFLHPKLPQDHVSPTKPGFDEYSEKIRRALAETCVALDTEWSKGGCHSGTTFTVALVSGHLLTVANCGDSSAYLDTGSQIVEMTNSHRIQVNKNEQHRLKNLGATLAPLGFHLQGPARANEIGVGPLRMWPGGLCVGRSIGDLDAGPLIVPVPHIRQVILPRKSVVRLVMASDGLWDVVPYQQALRSIRAKVLKDAPTALAAAVLKQGRLTDDMTAMVVDISGVPRGLFPTYALKGDESQAPLKRQGSKKGGLFSCFKPTVKEECDEGAAPTNLRVPSSHTELQLYADVDCLTAYPGIEKGLSRMSIQTPIYSEQDLRIPDSCVDYTVHGGPKHSLGSHGSIPDHGKGGKGSKASEAKNFTVHGGKLYEEEEHWTLSEGLPKVKLGLEDVRLPDSLQESSLARESSRSLTMRLSGP